MLVEQQKSFKVIGIATRTTNKEALEKGTIQALWQRFFAEQIFGQIPHKVDESVIALYGDYETDKDGEYLLVIGARVSSLDEIPQGMIGYEVPAAKRAVFVTAEGPLSSIVFNEWKAIWAKEEEGLLERAYTVDYELYDEQSTDPMKARVKLFIAVK